MFKKVKPSVLNLLHTIFGVKMPSSSPWNPLPSVLPGIDHENIKPYTQRLAAMAVMEKGGGLTLLRKWRVKHVRAYKSMSGSRHEYITAAVTMADSESNISYVVIERHVGDPIRDNVDPAPPGPFSSSNSSLSSIPSHSDSVHPAAKDRIGSIDPPGKREETDELIYELNFDSGKQLYLYELAVLALIVHEENVSYLLMSNNCYHYAGTIMKVLEQEYGLANSVVGGSAGKWWCGVVIFPHKKGLNSLSLPEKFREEMKKFVSLLYQIINVYLRTLVYRNLGQ
jgi:hypothetical protein